MTHPISIKHSQAIKLIQHHAGLLALATETVKIVEACGRVTAADIKAPINVPEYTCSRMDGYAVNLSQSKTKHGDFSFAGESYRYSLEIGAAIHAKHQPKSTVCGASAIPIMTGGLMPADADGILLKENVVCDENRIYFGRLPKKGEYMRAPGSDLQQGQVVIKGHEVLTAASLGLLSSLGFLTVSVITKPRIALMMTGDELVQPGAPCLPGQVYDANGMMLNCLLTQMGCQVTLFEPIEDSKSAVLQRLEQLSNNTFDVILTVGGVSMGGKDWIPGALIQQGSVVFHKLQIKPGFPMLFGQLGSALFYGLPGNPVSSYTTLCQYVYPAIQIMTHETPSSHKWRARLTHDLKKSHPRREYMRGTFITDNEGHLQVSVCGGQQSSRIESLAQANCFIMLDERTNDLSSGSVVEIHPFTDFKKANG